MTGKQLRKLNSAQNDKQNTLRTLCLREMLHISDNLQLSSFPLKSSTADLAMTKDQMMKELCVLGIHTRHSGRLCHELTEFLIRACPRSRTQFTVLLCSSNPRHIKAFQQ